MKTSFFCFVFFLALSAQAQRKSLDFVVGYGIPDFKIRHNNNTFLKESKSGHSYYAGFTYCKSPSKGQMARKGYFMPSIAVDFGLSRNTGNFKRERWRKKESYYEDILYQVYRIELGVFPKVQYQNFFALAGPTLYGPFYATRQWESQEQYEHNMREYKNGCLALTVGLGYQYSVFSADLRYMTTLSEYGRAFRGQEFHFSERQFRLTAAIRLFQLNKEKNSNSIFWD